MTARRPSLRHQPARLDPPRHAPSRTEPLARPPARLFDHQRYVVALARRLTSDEHAAEDVAQQTWVVALSRPPHDARALKPWLSRVVRSVAIDQSRRRLRRGDREARVEPPEPGRAPDEELERALARSALAAAVAALGAPYREAIRLRYLEGLPTPLAAARLGVPVETLRTRLRRGLALLRGRLGPEARGWRAAAPLPARSERAPPTDRTLAGCPR